MFVSSCADSLMAVTPGVNQQSKWLSAANLWLGPRGVGGIVVFKVVVVVLTSGVFSGSASSGRKPLTFVICEESILLKSRTPLV